jgi:glycosyltransferase involved in cell wall biosynthesis
MTALFVADVFFPDTIGGAGRMARHLAEGLAREQPVVVVCRNEGGRLPPYERHGDLEIHRFLVDRSRSDRFLASAMKSCLLEIWRLAATRRFDRLILNQPLSGAPALPLAHVIPTVYIFHSPWSEEYRTQLGRGGRVDMRQRFGLASRRAIERQLVRAARKVMVLSGYMGNLLRQLQGMPAERIVTIPGGVDVKRFAPGLRDHARAAFGMPAQGEIILTVRNLVPRMGLFGLVEAFDLLRRCRPKAELFIAGLGPLRQQLEQRIADLGLDGRVHLMGRVNEEQLPELYRTADVFIMATAALEGFGLATVEALASGTPVVGTPVGATPEILSQINATLLARSSSPADVADALGRFFERTPAARRGLAERGRELCARQYAWPLVTEAFNKLVRSVG